MSGSLVDGAQQQAPQAILAYLLEVREFLLSRLDEDGYISGAPELACELAMTSANIDLHHKLLALSRQIPLEAHARMAAAISQDIEAKERMRRELELD